MASVRAVRRGAFSRREGLFPDRGNATSVRECRRSGGTRCGARAAPEGERNAVAFMGRTGRRPDIRGGTTTRIMDSTSGGIAVNEENIRPIQESKTINVDEILAKYDKESTFRILSGSWEQIIKIICICFSLQ